ncbi:MAG TPA: hypothetical protein VMH28_31650 [Candidatus Acidoferrales bacterium]|nr:hypothetical protein [Candidatus Acidoferrales bacterium]
MSRLARRTATLGITAALAELHASKTEELASLDRLVSSMESKQP